VPAFADVPEPERFNVVNAPELIVAAPKLFRVAVVIVPAAVAEAALASSIVTAPFAIPICPVVAVSFSVSAFVWFTVTAVVKALPLTSIAPSVVVPLVQRERLLVAQL
jgi:hypothetical protein